MITAGVDEAGRGALAGSVVAGAVILPKGADTSFLDDSKKLTDQKRRAAILQIQEKYDWGVGIVSAKEVDELGIKKATNKAMQIAVSMLKTKPEKLLIDGRDKFVFEIESEDIVRGDETEPAISAASIIAKVTRDDLMIELSQKYPQFGFERNAGYGTKSHYDLLEKEIYCSEHRKSYEPLKTWLVQGRLF